MHPIYKERDDDRQSDTASATFNDYRIWES